MRDEAGLLGNNAVTLLAAFILVLMVVMGGFTVTSSEGGLEGAQEPRTTEPYAVVVNESTVVLENVEGDLAAYDQLALYVSSDSQSQRLDVGEHNAAEDDGDMLFERRERVVRPLNESLETGTPVTVSLVDAAGAEIRFQTTVNVTGGKAV